MPNLSEYFTQISDALKEHEAGNATVDETREKLSNIESKIDSHVNAMYFDLDVNSLVPTSTGPSSSEPEEIEPSYSYE